MKDPDRWLNDANLREDVRELLQAGETPPPMPETQHQRIGVFVTRAAAGTLATSLLFSTKVLAAMLVLTAGGAATWATVKYASERTEDRSHEVERAPSASVVTRHQAQPSTTGALDKPPEATETRSTLVLNARESAAKPNPASQALPTERRVRSRQDSASRMALVPRAATDARGDAHADASAQATQEAHPQDSLAAEATMLEQARAVLTVNPEAALAQAEAHAHLYRKGQLASERELIAIDALQRLGRTSAAQRRAQALIAREPNGMYARRARRLVGTLGTNGAHD